MDSPQSCRRSRGPLRAILFDWAGTVVDFGSRAPVLAMSQVFRNLGVELTSDEVRGPMGMAKRDHIRAVMQVPRVVDAWRRAVGSEPDERAIDKVYDAFLQSQRDLLLDISPPIPGARQAVDACRRRGMKIGLSTGYTTDLMRPLVEAAREQGLTFDAVLCADDVPQGRPAPWLCLENARRLNAYPVGAMVAVDDTPVGIEAGLNAGMWTVGVARSGNLVGLSEQEFNALPQGDKVQRVAAATQRLLDVGAHYVVDTVADLSPVLDQIERCLAGGIGP